MKRYEIHWSKRARKDYEALDKGTKNRIDGALRKLADIVKGEDTNLDIKALKGKYEGYYRLRVGRWRIVFTYIPENRVLYTVGIYYRPEAYR